MLCPLCSGLREKPRSSPNSSGCRDHRHCEVVGPEGSLTWACRCLRLTCQQTGPKSGFGTSAKEENTCNIFIFKKKKDGNQPQKGNIRTLFSILPLTTSFHPAVTGNCYEERGTPIISAWGLHETRTSVSPSSKERVVLICVPKPGWVSESPGELGFRRFGDHCPGDSE